jgi:hypothetical protein
MMVCMVQPMENFFGVLLQCIHGNAVVAYLKLRARTEARTQVFSRNFTLQPSFCVRVPRRSRVRSWVLTDLLVEEYQRS